MFFEEENFIDTMLIVGDISILMIIDSGAPISLISHAWIELHLKEANVDDNEIKRCSSERRFRFIYK